MVNLLSKKEKQKLFTTYYVRLAITLLLLVSGAIIIGGVLLTPSYIVAEKAADASERYLAALEETVGIRERAGVSDDVRALGERLRILDQYSKEVSYAPFFEDAFSTLSPSIRVTGIAFKKEGEVLLTSVSGVAKTRSALLAFADALRASGKFEGVTIPVSQLAQDEDIPFSIAATYRSAP